ncbi:hypothetical protein OEZ60_20590 [Defluviimonas sp. WL0024]|uniref:Peptidase S24/S26A/S26B/S26C domain-containing protein n=1 Tax=Albidovulum salinarum TaxID=2984153 RepID=A0ABT2XBG9_9RHOB|nr:S24 family peptidase [Defluviimonas sp. WL0024]MCU9850387.1 hypothetical protein [Defluviimonas sp. WL0024]
MPDSNYLAAVEKAGVDVLYVLTGKRIRPDATLVHPNGNIELEVKSTQGHGAGSHALDDLTPIDVYAVEAAAGGGRLNREQGRIGTLAFRRDWLASLGIRPSKAKILRVCGDSMEPTIRDGAIVLVDEDRKSPDRNFIYAFLEGEELRLKRLDLVQGKILTISSDNPAYPAEVRVGAEINDLTILGRVVWTACRLGEPPTLTSHERTELILDE